MPSALPRLGNVVRDRWVVGDEATPGRSADDQHLNAVGALDLPWLPIVAVSGTAGRFRQESKIGAADAGGALDGSCPPRTMT